MCCLTVINVNARSLSPKIESLSDCVTEVGADIAIVTETWLQDGEINDTVIESAGNYGLDVFTLNRQQEAANGG